MGVLDHSADRTTPEASAAERRAQVLSTLQRLADAIGQPVEVFTANASTDGLSEESAELLRLWLRIRSPEERRKVIDLVRVVASLTTN